MLNSSEQYLLIKLAAFVLVYVFMRSELEVSERVKAFFIWLWGWLYQTAYYMLNIRK